ncbi:hypothetical protein BCR42DRAFT_399549 [Absidia repens]|uniref:F-box domain-containing protein n=1 Tax=Absidia repens TaxID=90262 RepID=A0A1X2J028_9FUNG|nr:hypothetical protein BCR42DRAFT_399549 [Absidia repens]
MDLPPELLGLIFEHLSQQRLPQCALVCQQWLQVARQHLYDSITLYTFDQMKRLIAVLNENNAIPPLGHLIRNILGASSRLEMTDIKAIEMHCAFLERIDLGNAPYVPLWYHLKQLSLTSISFRDWRIGQWLTYRGHQLNQLTTNLDTFWGRCSPYASFTMIVMTCPAGHFANLVSLTLAKGDTAYYSHRSDPELELDPNLLHIIHGACPVLTSISFVYPRLPVSFKNMTTTATLPPITTVTTTAAITTIQQFPNIRTLRLKISSRTSSLFFDLFAIMYPCIERLDLEIEEVNKDDDIRRRLRTPQLFDNYRARLFNMATSFTKLKEMRLHTTLTHDILEVYWAHHGWIDWIDAHSMVYSGTGTGNGLINGEDEDDHVNNSNNNNSSSSDHNSTPLEQRMMGRNRLERLDMTTQTGRTLSDRDRIYVGNGTSLIQLSHLSISLDMVLPKLMTDSLFHGRQTWPHLTTLQLKTNKHKVIVMDVLLSAAPHLVSLKLQSVTFKSCLWGKRQSAEQQQAKKKRRINYNRRGQKQQEYHDHDTTATALDQDEGDSDDNDENDDNSLPSHGLEKLDISTCELPAMDMITQWMARCPKLKELTGKGLDFYGQRDIGVSGGDTGVNGDHGNDDGDDDYGNGGDVGMHNQQGQNNDDDDYDNPLPLVSINDWSPYNADEYIQSTPLVHIYAPDHQLDFLSLEDIHYHSLAKDHRKTQHYGLFLSLVVEQLWRSPPPSSISSPMTGPWIDMHRDCYSNSPQKAYLTQKCSGSMIQSPNGYIKLTCQSLDNFVW